VQPRDAVLCSKDRYLFEKAATVIAPPGRSLLPRCRPCSVRGAAGGHK
jgi:hypothetical protein